MSSSAPCINCSATNRFVNDDHAGQRTCTNCGAVAEERMIQWEEPEYRIFEQDDNGNKQRVGTPQSIFDLDTSNPDHRYLKELKEHTADVLSVYYFCGNRVPKLILNNAFDVVEKAYRLQKREKQFGTEDSVPAGCSDKTTTTLRQKYSHRIVIVVCGCYVALQASQIPNVTIDFLCSAVTSRVSMQLSSHTFATPKSTAVLKMLQRLKMKKHSGISTRLHRVPMCSGTSRILRR